MKATQLLHNLGQSLWLDNITRDLLDAGTLQRYIDELSVTGLTSNPTIFDQAIKGSAAYDAGIRDICGRGEAARRCSSSWRSQTSRGPPTLFRPIYERTNGVDGWVSLEVSPLLAYDTASTLAAAKELYARAARANLFIKIPGTQEGLPAIEEAIFAGDLRQRDPVVFARALPRGRRGVSSRHRAAASLPGSIRTSARLLRCSSAGGMSPSPTACPRRCATNSALPSPGERIRPPSLCSVRRAGSASTMSAPARNACCGPARGRRIRRHPTILYVKALAAPFTVNTMPEATLKALATHSELGSIMPAGRRRLRGSARGIRQDRRRYRRAWPPALQDEGAKSFVKSWNHLMEVIASKSASIEKAR